MPAAYRPFQVDAVRLFYVKLAANGPVFLEEGRGNAVHCPSDGEGTPEMRSLKNIDVASSPDRVSKSAYGTGIRNRIQLYL